MITSSGSIRSDNGTQTQGIPLQSQVMFKQPVRVQSFAQMKLLFRNFVTWDIQEKINRTDELIEATSKMISTKKDLRTLNLQKLNHASKIMEKCPEA